MKVLLIPSWYPAHRGDVAGSFFREQAIALKRQGCDVSVLTVHLAPLSQLPGALFSGGSSVEIDEGVPTYRFRGVKWTPKLALVQAVYWRKRGLALFSQYIAEHGLPDIVHVHSMLNAGLVAEDIKQKYGVPYVITEHKSVYARGAIKGRRKSMAAGIAKRAERRYAVSSTFATFLTGFLGRDSGLWGVLPNIVNDSFLNYPLSGGRGELFTFLSVGFHNKNKRLDLLLHAFSQAFRDETKVRLRIGGEGPETGRLKELARGLRIEEQVTFLGMLSRTEVVEQLSSADAFLLGSQYETFGVAVIEALALGLPVISTQCGGPEDVITPRDGVLVPVDDEKQMADAMRCLYDQPGRYDRSTIREACRARFSEQAVSAQLMNVYADVLESQR